MARPSTSSEENTTLGILKFASKETKRIELGDGDWIEVKSDLSKKSFNELLAAMPNRQVTEEDGLTLTEGLKFAEALFESLVTAWSVPQAATLENYLELDQTAAQAVDAKLIEHFGEISPSKDEMSKVSTSRGSRQRANGPTR
jgi:hypothetical protein